MKTRHLAISLGSQRKQRPAHISRLPSPETIRCCLAQKQTFGQVYLNLRVLILNKLKYP